MEVIVLWHFEKYLQAEDGTLYTFLLEAIVLFGGGWENSRQDEGITKEIICHFPVLASEKVIMVIKLNYTCRRS